ncbi:hypothetical protein [Microbacterium sp. IEGM 1404]|uniref:hypothetical protein n=1 Tax=Microbacterium sp. IEGM 1404 TaxID=3047084 RepID=UPI0024B80090|nr:hypothetical protein [Microbacterium sp. IEGM 1404]MDI9892878.1 hypothetical protein [Microbacterium sp. IEGM 1404]
MSARTWTLDVGGIAREELVRQLDAAGIRRNPYAEVLLADPVFDTRAAETIDIVERSVADLGLADGGTLAQVHAAAEANGLALCPPDTAPYLRLVWLDQEVAPDSILSTGRAPTASLQVATPALRADHDYPRGFYLRVIDGEPWLRGFRCDDEYVAGPGERPAFRVPRGLSARTG